MTAADSSLALARLMIVQGTLQTGGSIPDLYLKPLKIASLYNRMTMPTNASEYTFLIASFG